MRDLDRLTPVSRIFGYDRGTPVDRRYIEAFLARHAADVRGRTLEIGDAGYTRAFGAGRVERADVLHVRAGNPDATYVGDLAGDNDLPDAAFDCVVLTQTLHLIYDARAALRTVRRVLRPGGVLLATVPGISNIDADEWGSTWYWSFTPAAVSRLANEVFGRADVEVGAYGNVKTAVAFLHGLAVEDLRDSDFEVPDPLYPLVVTLRAVRSSGQEADPPLSRQKDDQSVR